MVNRSGKKKPQAEPISMRKRGREKKAPAVDIATAAKVSTEANEAAVQFLHVEIRAALAFLQASKSYSNQARIEQSKAQAAKAFYSVLAYLPKVRLSKEEKRWILEKLQEIRKRLGPLVKIPPPLITVSSCFLRGY